MSKRSGLYAGFPFASVAPCFVFDLAEVVLDRAIKDALSPLAHLQGKGLVKQQVRGARTERLSVRH